MIDLLYPWMYFDMSGEGEGDNGGGEGGGGEGGGGGGGDPAASGEESYYESVSLPVDVINEVEVSADYGIYGIDPDEESKKAPIKIKVVDVTAIPGDKLLQSLVIPSSLKNPLIGGIKEGNILAEGLNAPAYIVGSPGGKFYLNIVDINDDEIFDLSNVTIPASGKYQMTIPFPKSTATNKYKINLRAGDGTKKSVNIPTTDPTWTIHQRANPTLTFAKATGTASGVAYSGSDVAFSTTAYSPVGIRTTGLQRTKLINSTTSTGAAQHSSVKLFGEFDYAVTAAKGSNLVYVKTTDFSFTNNTFVEKRLLENVVNSNVIRISDTIGLSVGMEAAIPNYTKTKQYSINITTLRLSDTASLEVGMILSGVGVDEETYITVIDTINQIQISKAITTNDTQSITFTKPGNNTITIKSIDVSLNRITLENPISIKLSESGYTTLSFYNNEMKFRNAITTSGSGSASTTLTNSIKMTEFGSKDVTLTLPTDSIFTLTPNAYDQYVEVTKDTAKDINVLAPDSDDNVGTKTPSIVRNPTKGVLSGGFGSGDGTQTYTPNYGMIGDDSFTFKVNDTITDSDTKTVFITITK